MKNKLIALVITIMFILSLTSSAVAFGYAAGNWKANFTAQELAQFKNRELRDRLKIAGKPIDFDLPPVIKGGRVLVPVRAITRGMGAAVDWEEATQTVTVTRGDVTVIMVLGQSYITVIDDEGTHTVQMDQLVQIISNRTFVPLRFLAEALGDKVDYDDDTGDIDVKTRLDTPEQPVLSDFIAEWEAVDHENDGYRVRLFRNTVEAARITLDHGDDLSYDFSASMDPAGIYTVRIMALGTGDYINSKESVDSLPQLVDVIIPDAPTDPEVDDEENTFGWTHVPGYSSIAFYEYSVDHGVTWNKCTANPQSVGNNNYAAGRVQVRIKADYSVGRPAGDELVSDAAFTATGQIRLATPDRPTLSSYIAEWEAVDHENDGYRLRLFRNGSIMITVTVAHGTARAHDFSASMTEPGSYTVKVTALGTGSYADSYESAASLPQIVNLTTPAAPTGPMADDEENTFGWTNVPGYTDMDEYEYSVNGGTSWTDCTDNPQSVGNHNYAAGMVQVRVKADLDDDRLAGAALASPFAFTAE